ncbi:MAG: arsenite methyltransferase, partial [Desulfurivibrionaceae bacterium]
REAVRKNYGKIASANDSGCGCSSKTCCGAPNTAGAVDISHKLGYSTDEVAGAPEGANLGLGCGNPQAIAALKPGETVLDLGSGAGFDSFLAAGAVGDTGRVIGVDMTPEMLAKARDHARKGDFKNIDFRLGELENLPVADNIVDVIISNCVINLSPDKERVFHEAFRVLKPGGRLAVSDVVRTAELPEAVANDPAMYSGCIAGASSIAELEKMLASAGFKEIKIRPKDESRTFIREWAPGTNVEDYVVSATIEALKPKS